MRWFMTRPEVRGTFGVVASTNRLASAAGMAMLERGGNRLRRGGGGAGWCSRSLSGI
jgi:hypothetical protein